MWDGMEGKHEESVSFVLNNGYQVNPDLLIPAQKMNSSCIKYSNDMGEKKKGQI